VGGGKTDAEKVKTGDRVSPHRPGRDLPSITAKGGGRACKMGTRVARPGNGSEWEEKWRNTGEI